MWLGDWGLSGLNRMSGLVYFIPMSQADVLKHRVEETVGQSGGNGDHLADLRAYMDTLATLRSKSVGGSKLNWQGYELKVRNALGAVHLETREDALYALHALQTISHHLEGRRPLFPDGTRKVSQETLQAFQHVLIQIDAVLKREDPDYEAIDSDFEGKEHRQR